MLALFAVLVMVSPVPFMAPVAPAAAQSDPSPEYTVTSMTPEQREAFVNLYMDVFVHKTEPFSDTPGTYPDYEPALRMSLVKDIIQAMKDDPQYAAKLEPVNAGPALGMSTPEDPLTDENGNPLTQERVDGVYTNFLYGLIFDRVKFIDHIQEVASEGMSPADSQPPEPTPNEEASEQDNAIRQEFAQEPVRHWGNLNETAIMPEDFVPYAAAPIEEVGIPAHDIDIPDVPAPPAFDLVAPPVPQMPFAAPEPAAPEISLANPAPVEPVIPAAPAAPRAPGAPAAPSTPGVPSVPVTPASAPSVPGVPGAPSVPGVPDVPTPPTVSASPTAPEAPGVPGVPGVPSVPGAPSAPGVPQAPEAPKAPGVPAAPAAPGVPGVPTAPSPPGVPGVPDAPLAPAAPGAPEAPGVPGVPGVLPNAPGVPGTPKSPGTPTTPEAPDIPLMPVAPTATLTLPDVPGVPGAPSVPMGPELPAAPSSPELPAVPDVPLSKPIGPAAPELTVDVEMPDAPALPEYPGLDVASIDPTELPDVAHPGLPTAPGQMEPPTIPAPAPGAVQPPTITSPELTIASVAPLEIAIPQLVPAPADIPAARLDSPLSAAPPDAWLDPAFSLDLPTLLDFLRDLAGLNEDALYDLLGLLDDALLFPEEIQGPLSEFTKVSAPVAELDHDVAAFAAGVEELLAPPALVDEAIVTDQVDALVAALNAAGQQLHYSGVVNGVRFNGTWEVPTLVDVDGDSMPDLMVQMALQPSTDGGVVGNVVSDGPVEPRMIVQRINGIVDPAAVVSDAVGVLQSMDPLADIPEIVLGDVTITREQIETAGLATASLLAQLEEDSENTFGSTSAFPYDLALAFHMPGSGKLVVHEVSVGQGADVLDVLVKGLGPAVEFATAGAAGEFSLATSVLHDETVEGDVATVAVSGEQPPIHMLMESNIDVARQRSVLEVQPTTPYDIQVLARRGTSSGGLGLVLSSEGLPATVATMRGDELTLTTVPGAALAVAHQSFTTSSEPFQHRGLVVENAKRQATILLTESRISVDSVERAATYRAVAGQVSDGYDHATWTMVQGAGREFTLDATNGLEFSNDLAPTEVRAVVAKSSAAALEVGFQTSGFKLNEELVAFALPGVRSATVRPDAAGGFAISTSTASSRAFTVDIEQQMPDGLQTQRFGFSNLPSSLSLDVTTTSINVGGSDRIDEVVGHLDRPLDGPSAPSTETVVHMGGLDGTASVALNAANVNVMANGAMDGGTVLSSNVVDAAGEHQYMAVEGNHMLAEVDGAARQHSAKLSNVASSGDGVGGIISGLAGGTGSIDVDLGMTGPFCWSFGKDSNVLRFCISNIPDEIGVDFQLVPSPSVTYRATDVIAEVSLQLLAPDVDILFAVRGIPEVVSLLFTDDGADLVMSDRLEAIVLAATLRDTTMAFGIESIPATMHFSWGATGMGIGIPDGDAIGRIYALISRPGLAFFAEIVHLPQATFDWGSESVSVDLGGHRIGSIVLQLVLAPENAPESGLQLLFEALGVPGVAASWTADGGSFGSDGALDSISIQLIQGIADNPNLSLIFEIEDVPRIEGATWSAASFDLDLGTQRIGRVFFQFLAGDMQLYLEAIGVPGLALGWGAAGGGLTTAGRLDRIEAFFRKGVTAPMIQVLLRIEEVPEIRSSSWGSTIEFDFAGDGRIGTILFEFLSDQVDDANDVLFQFEANGLPGFALDPDARTLATDERIEHIRFYVRLGPEAAPPLLVGFELVDVPKIALFSWAQGVDLSFEPADAQVERIELIFRSDLAGTASDFYAHFLALGVPGLLLDATTGAIESRGVLDELTLDFRLGDIMDPDVLMIFGLTGVPQMRAGAFGDGGFSLGFSPADARIEEIMFLFQARQPGATPGELQIYLQALGFPGIELGLGDAGTLATHAPLDSLTAHFHVGPVAAPTIQFNFIIADVPVISGATWQEDRFNLGLDGQIGQIAIEFVLDAPDDASDLYLLFDSRGVPGIDVRWPNGQGSIATNGNLDSLNLVGIVGPRSGMDLVGEGVYARLSATNVARITQGTWGTDNFVLGLDGRIDEILLEFRLDLPDDASDIFMLLRAQGVPGIEARWPDGVGILETQGTLDLLEMVAVVGGRDGFSLKGEGLSIRFSLAGVPAITGGVFEQDAFALGLDGRIDQIILELVMDLPGTATDVYLLFNSRGVPGLAIRWPEGVGTIETADTLEELNIVGIVGPRDGLRLVGEGLSLALAASGIPAISNGQFEQEAFHLDLDGRIDRFTVEVIFDQVGTAADLYLILDTAGVPGIDVRWPDGQGILTTQDQLDSLHLFAVLGGRDGIDLVGEGLALRFVVEGLPAITGGQFRDDAFVLGLDGRIDNVVLELIMDQAGTASDVYLLFNAQGVPGIDVRWPDGTGTITTTGALDVLTLVGIVGPRDGLTLAGEGISIIFTALDVPAITGGQFQDSAFALGLDGRIGEIIVELIVDQTGPADIYVLLNAQGVPGIDLRWPDGVGTLETAGTLDALDIVAILGPRTDTQLVGEGLSLRFSAREVPAITGGQFQEDAFALGLDGRIADIVLELVLDQADDATDVYLLFNAQGVPGIDVRWPDGQGTFTTAGQLDLLTLVAILGPRTGIDLVGEGLSAKFVLKGLPAVTGGAFGDNVLALGLDGRIEEISLEFILDAAEDTADAYVLFNSLGVPGIDVRWPDGVGTLSTTGTLDELSLVALLGARDGMNLVGEGLSVKFIANGIPAITGGEFGGDVFALPMDGRIEHIGVEFILDAADDAADAYVLLNADGIPGVDVRWPGGVGTISTTGVLDEIGLVAVLGPRSETTLTGEGMSARFLLRGVPAITGGEFGGEVFALPMAGQIQEISVEFILNSADDATDGYVLLSATGVPGINVRWPAGQGTFATTGTLNALDFVAILGPRAGTTLVGEGMSATFVLRGMPAVTDGVFGGDAFNLGLAGQIEQVGVEFILDLAGEASDVYALLDAQGLPGIELGFTPGGGTISTSDTLDLLNIVLLVGPRDGLDLAGVGLSAKAVIKGVPAITDGEFGGDAFALPMAGQIEEISIEVILDAANNAADGYALLSAKGIPGIDVRWPAGAGTFTTTGTLDELSFLAILGPRSGTTLVGEGMSATFVLRGMPAVTGGQFGGDVFALGLDGQIEQVAVEFILDLEGQANDVYALLDAQGLPGIELGFTPGGGTINTTDALNLLNLVLLVGPRDGMNLDGVGLSAKAVIKNVPAITGGEFGGDAFALPMTDRIEEISIEVILDAADDAADGYALLSAKGIPGIDVRWPGGAGTFATTGTLDELSFLAILGPRSGSVLVGEGMSATFVLRGMPAITDGQFGGDVFALGLDGQIEQVAVEFILDLEGRANDVYALIDAQGLPGIELGFTPGGGTITTTDALNSVNLALIVGPRNGLNLIGPGLSAKAVIQGVPAITGGEFGGDVFALPMAGQIEEISFEAILDDANNANDGYVLLSAKGIPGIDVRWPGGDGTFTTTGVLDELSLVAILGPRSGTTLAGEGMSATFVLRGMPAVTDGRFAGDVFALGFEGQIAQVAVEFILDLAGQASDVYALLDAQGLPGIELGFTPGGGTISTTDTLDLINLALLVGPRSGLTLVGPGLSAKAVIRGVPAITGGEFGGDVFALPMADRIEEISFEAILNDANDANDGYALLTAKGIPGIDVRWPDGAGTIETTGTLDELSFVAILGPRSGTTLVGEGLSATFVLLGMPAISDGRFGGDAFALGLTGQIQQISAELIVDLAEEANDVYALLDAQGLPGIELGFTPGGGTISTTGTLDLISMALLVGPRDGLNLDGPGLSAKAVIKGVPAITGGEFGGDVFALPMADRIEEISFEAILNDANDANDGYALLSAKGIPGIDVRWPGGDGTFATTGVLDELSFIAILGPRVDTSLVGEGMSATFVLRGMPAVTGGQFSDEVFALGLNGQIEQVAVELILDLADEANDVYALLDAQGLPGIELGFTPGGGTISTTDVLDKLSIALLVGPRDGLDLDGVGFSAKFVVAGVPVITGGAFGGDVFALPMVDRIEEISLEIILDAADDAADGYILMSAYGVPGIDIRWPGGDGTFSTTGVLDSFNLIAVLGPRDGFSLVGEGMVATFALFGMPQVTGGRFAGDGFALGLDGQVQQIALEFMLDVAGESGDVYALLDARGLPGIDVGFTPDGGTIATTGTLNLLEMVVLVGPRVGFDLAGEGLSAKFVVKNLPAITGGEFGSEVFALPMDGRIEEITLEVILDAANDAADGYILLTAQGIPGIDVRWPGGDGTFSTSDQLDLLEFVAILGPRVGTTLVGEGMSASFVLRDVPAISDGRFTADAFNLGLTGQIGQLRVEFILDLANDAGDIYALLDAQGLPGIALGFTPNGGTISTTDVLDFLNIVLLVGPREGLTLAGNGLSAKFSLEEVPVITGGEFGGDAFALPMVGQIKAISLEVILDVADDAADGYLLLSAGGVPGIDIRWPEGQGTFETTDQLDRLSIVAILGPREGTKLVGEGMSAAFQMAGLPAITGGRFGQEIFALGMDGRIDKLGVEFIMDLAGEASDVYARLSMEGVPGIELAFTSGGGTITTTGTLDLVNIALLIGPREDLNLTGVGLAARFLATSVPAITGGEFGGDVFALPMDGRIEEISVGLVLDAADDAFDGYAALSAKGVPGIDVRWPNGAGTFETTGRLDSLNIVAIMGPRVGTALAGEGMSATFNLEGVPAITGGRFGTDIFALGMAGQIEQLGVEFILDLAGDTNDVYALFDAQGLPGIELGFTPGGGTISTTDTLDLINLALLVGARDGLDLVGPGLSAKAVIRSVPIITGGEFGGDVFALPMADRIEEISFEAILDDVNDANDGYALLTAKGIPGIDVRWPGGAGTIETTGVLDELSFVAILGPRSGTTLVGEGLSATFVLLGMPAISDGRFGADAFALGMTGQIQQISAELIVDLADEANDVYALFDAQGLPGIELGFTPGGGTISTTDALGLINLALLVGPRDGLNLVGPGLSAKAVIRGVPAITGGEFGGDVFALPMADRIEEISFEAILDDVNDANDGYALLTAKGIPGIDVRWPGGAGTIETTGVLDELSFVAILGPRSGTTLVGEGLSATFTLLGMPAISDGRFGADAFALGMTGQIQQISAELIVDLAGQATDVYALLDAQGLPGIELGFTPGGGTISTTDNLDLVNLALLVGPRNGLNLVGPGLSAKAVIRGVPPITGGEFGGDVFALPMADRIEEISFEAILDDVNDANDGYALLTAKGIPGIDVRWPGGAGTIETTGVLDELSFVAILGPRSGTTLVGEGLSATFTLLGMPAISDGRFGADAFALGMTGQIQQISAELIVDLADEANDVYALFDAQGLPGIELGFTPGGGTISTTDALGLINLALLVGPRDGLNLDGPGLSAKAVIRGVPAITGGEFGGDVFALPMNGRIEEISFEAILDAADDANDGYALLTAKGIPGIDVRWPEGAGTIETTGVLDELSFVAILGPRSGTRLVGEGLSATFTLLGMPAISDGRFGADAFALGMTGQIRQISAELIVDLAGQATDVYALFDAQGLPGIELGFTPGGGTISTTDDLDLINLALLVGPRNGLNLVGPGLSAKAVIKGVPAITGGEFGGDVFALPMADRIEEISFEAILDDANDANDGYALLSAKGIPGIDVRWPGGAGTFSTTGALDELTFVAILGPRTGSVLSGEGMSATFELRGMPAITGGEFGADAFAAGLQGQIEQLTLQLVVDLPGVATDVLAVFDARGVPGIDVRWPNGAATMSTTDRLNSLDLVILVGERRELNLIGEGLSVKFNIRDMPRVTGGQFGGDVFALGLDGQIAEIGLEFILNLEGTATDAYVLFNSQGVPGIDVRWPEGVGSITTTGPLDLLQLVAIVGPRSGTTLTGEGLSAKFVARGVPAITGGEFGGEVFALPMAGRIQEISVELIVDLASVVSDAYLLLQTLGVPGIDVRWPGGVGSLSTSGVLDELNLVAILGPRSGTTLTGEGMSATFSLKGVPRITGGSFGSESFNLNLNGQIESITLELIYDQAGVSTDAYALFEALGVPGIALGWADDGSITTNGNLDSLQLAAVVGQRTGTTLVGEGLSILFSITDVPPVSGTFGDTHFNLGLAGRIGEILLEFILDQGGTAADAYVLFNSRGVPGINVAWPEGAGSISTSGTLDLLDLLAIVGPRAGTALNGEGLSVRFTATSVPAITGGTFGEDVFALGLDGQIASILLEFILDQDGTAADAYVLFNSQGVPGIDVRWPEGVGSISTTGPLNLLNLVAVVGPRNGVTLAGEGLSVTFTAKNVPTISSGAFGGEQFSLGLDGRIEQIALEFILNMADDATDAYVLFNSLGVPGINVAWPDGVGSITTTGALDLLNLVAIVGPRSGTNLVGEGLSAKFTMKGLPAISAGAFGGEVFSLGLDGQIEEISFEFILDLADTASDVYALFNSEGVPGISVAWPDSGTTFSTTDALDLLDLLLIVGPRTNLDLVGEGLYARFTAKGVPAISASSMGEAGLNFGLTGRIEEISLLFRLDQSGTAADLYASFSAKGVPGIAVGWDDDGGTITTTGALDDLSLTAIVGPRTGTNLAGQGMSAKFNMNGVPRLTAGSWSQDSVSLGLNGQIAGISLEFILDLAGTAADVYALFNAEGVPGITIGLGSAGGTLSTGAALDLLDLLVIVGGRSGTSLSGNGLQARLVIEDVPRLTASGWDSDSLSLSMDGRIGEILLEFILNQAGTASDAYALFNSKGVPGITVSWDSEGGSIGTSGVLDLLNLVAILGPRSGTTLNGEGMSAQLVAKNVPQLSAGGWDKDSISIDLAGRIEEISLEFVLNLAGTATDAYLLFNSKGVPGIGVDFSSAGGSISTQGTLDELGLVGILGPRSGQNLNGVGASVKFTATGIPKIESGSWDSDSFDLDLGTNKITDITFEVFVNQATDANDIYLMLNAGGIPSLSVGSTTTGFAFDAPRGIDTASLVFRKGSYAYDPNGYGDVFLGAWLRPDGYGTASPGVLQFGVTAKISNFKGASWTSTAASNSQELAIKFTNDPTVRTVVDLQTSSIVATADLVLTNLPATTTISISPDATTYTGTRACNTSGCKATTPWLQGNLAAGTRATMDKVPDPYWPWETTSDPAGKCTRSGSSVHCGIMGNTYLDLKNTGLAAKIKIDVPVGTEISFSKTTSNGVPSYDVSSSAKMGKLDLRVNTLAPLPVSPHELNVMAVATVSNLPTSLSMSNSMGSNSAPGKPSATATAGQTIERAFLGLRFDGNWYADPGTVGNNYSDVTSAGFPIWMTLEDIPSSVAFTVGKSSYDTANCSSCNPAVPQLTYTASARTLDAALYVNIGQLWNTIGRTAIKDGGSSVPDWLRGLAAYDSQGHMLLQLVDVPRDGVAISMSGGKLTVDPSPTHGERLGRFFADFQLKFSDGASQPSKCFICLDFAELSYYWHYNWWFGIETLSLLLEDLGKVTINPSLESKIEIDGKLVFHFRAGAGFSAGAGLELYVLDSRVLCVCINLPTVSLILDPGFISFQVLNYECCTIEYFYLGWPCEDDWVPSWCDRHYKMGIRGKYPGNWGFDLPIAVPPTVPFRGLNVQYGTHSVFINPRTLLCAGVDWKNPTAVCVELGRLYPSEFIVAYGFAKYFEFRVDTWTVDHTH